MSDNNFIEPGPWTDELEEIATEQLIQWVGKNCHGNPTISKESIIDSIHADVDLPNVHPTMQAIYELPDGKKFKGYPAIVDFFEGLGYSGFPPHNMPDYLNPDIEAEDTTDEELLDANNYLKEIQGASEELDRNLEKKLAANKTNPVLEPILNKSSDIDTPLNSQGDNNPIKPDEFSDSDLKMYGEMAERASRGEDVGINVGGETETASPSNKESSQDVEKDQDKGSHAVNFDDFNDKETSNQAGTDAIKNTNVPDVPKENENKPPKKQQQQQQQQRSTPGAGVNFDFGVGAIIGALGTALSGSASLTAKLAKGAFSPFSIAGNFAVNKKRESVKNKAYNGDPKLAVFAEAKVEQVNKTKNGIMNNLNLLSSGLNANGEPASNEEKKSMRNLLSTHVQDYSNRLAEAQSQLGNPDLGIKHKKELMSSIKDSNNVLKALDGDNSDEVVKLKDQTKHILEAISKLLKSMFGRGKNKDNETSPAI